MNTHLPESNVLAFYGIHGSSRAAAPCYEAVLAWLQTNRCPPDRLGVHGKGFSGKLIGFPSAHSRLKKRGFDDIESVEIQSQPPEGDPKAIDGRMSVDMSFRNEYIILAMDSSVGSFDAMWQVARTVVAHFSPDYGIGFSRERRLGPAFYALGMNYTCGGDKLVFSGPLYEEKVRISSWTDGMELHVYRDGLLRDVYPHNFLTSPQLSRRVAGVPLQTWIEQEPSRGRLAAFEGDMSIWSVEQSAIPRIREVLLKEGMLFDAQTYFNRAGPAPEI